MPIIGSFVLHKECKQLVGWPHSVVIPRRISHRDSRSKGHWVIVFQTAGKKVLVKKQAVDRDDVSQFDSNTHDNTFIIKATLRTFINPELLSTVCSSSTEHTESSTQCAEMFRNKFTFKFIFRLTIKHSFLNFVKNKNVPKTVLPLVVNCSWIQSELSHWLPCYKMSNFKALMCCKCAFV